MQLQTRSPSRAAAPREVRPPSVLVVLVVKDGAEWLPRCLTGISHQTYPRLGVIAIDNGSTDESVDLLEGTLGAARVIPLNRNLGFPGAVAAALRSDVAEQADYVLLMHDDTVLAPNAVANLVAAAERIDGVGVVGPKVLDWEEPQVLREIGHSTDRFGYPYSPLDDGEIDQGQYERIRDVLFVSSCAMLVSRSLWRRIGPPDERLAGSYDDLDYCWRARLAGFKVLMTPNAVAHHREATSRGKRPGGPTEVRVRYERERAALASMLKNYSFFSLLWVLPLYLVLGLLRVAAFILSRKFEDAYQLLSAWRWNLVRIPGTLRRRWRAQRVRAVRDRMVRQSMAPAGIRLRRWMLAAASTLLPQSIETEGGPPVPVAVKVVRYVGAHPVAAAWGVGSVVALVAYRTLFTASPLVGGALGTPPSSPLGYFTELASGLRHTGLGGNYAASPALALLGAGSGVALGSPALFQKVLLLALPLVAAVGCYQAVRAATDARVPAAVAAVCYGLSSVVLWGVSSGELAALVFLAGVPWLVTKLGYPFRRDFRVPRTRWVAGAGVGLAVLMAFFPGTALAVVLVVIGLIAVPVRNRRRSSGLALAAAAFALGAALIFPLTIDLIRSAGEGLGRQAAGGTFPSLARLALRPGPGLWRTGFYLPLAVVVGLPFIPANRRADAARAAGVGIVALYLAWLSAHGYLPTAVSNPIAYLGVVAFEYVFLLGLALASLANPNWGAAKQRRIAVGMLGVIVGLGLLGQIAQAARGRWTVGGPERIPAAYPIVTDQQASAFRVLWVGRIGRESFAAPGGSPDGSIEAGVNSIRFAVRGPEGASSVDVGRAALGPGYRYLRTVLEQIARGTTRHAGALLAPLSVRYIVAEDNDLSEVVLRRLMRQVDLDAVPAGGLVVLRNAKVVPIYAVIDSELWRRTAFSGRLADVEMLPAPPASRLGVPEPAAPDTRPLVLAGQQFDRRWTMSPADGGPPIRPRLAFTWAVGFEGQPATGTAVRFDGNGERRVEMVVLGVLWLVTLWLIRKPPRA